MKTTKTSKYLMELRKLKAKHAVRYCKDFPNRKSGTLEIYANVDDVTLKRAQVTSMEGYANRLIAELERAEQAAIRANPPVFDPAYVERADFSIMSLYSDYKDEIEAGNLTWVDYRAERKHWRKCKYKFCLNMFPVNKRNFKGFPAKRKDSRYCCDECRTAARDANERFKKTGSYLPESHYLPRLSESVGDDIRKYEYAADRKTIQRNVNQNRPVRRAVISEDRIKPSPVTTYKTVEDAERAYAKSDLRGRVKIN